MQIKRVRRSLFFINIVAKIYDLCYNEPKLVTRADEEQVCNQVVFSS